MKKLISTVIVIAIACNAFAQEKTKLFEIKSASWQYGLYSGESGVSNFSDFKKLAPDMTLNEMNLAGFSNKNIYFDNSGPAFSGNIILVKSDQEERPRFNPEFRVGISFQQADLISLNYHRKDEFRIDTLVSASSGKEYYVDSIQTQDYNLNYSQRQVMIEGDVIISTNPNKRWKFYGGVGVSLGLSVSPKTQIYYNSNTFIEGRNSEKDDYDFEVDGSFDQYSNKGGFYGRLYLPLGVDFRIGQRKESLKQYHLFAESRQSLNFQSIPELTSGMTVASVTGFGLRYDF